MNSMSINSDSILNAIKGTMVPDGSTTETLIQRLKSIFVSSFQECNEQLNGVFTKDMNGLISPLSMRTRIGSGSMTVVNHCHLVDPLEFCLNGETVVIHHEHIGCFLEIPIDTTNAIRVYFNPKATLFVSAKIKYNEQSTGPYAAKPLVEFFRVIPVDTTRPQSILESFLGATHQEAEPPGFHEDFYRPYH